MHSYFARILATFLESGAQDVRGAPGEECRDFDAGVGQGAIVGGDNGHSHLVEFLFRITP